MRGGPTSGGPGQLESPVWEAFFFSQPSIVVVTFFGFVFRTKNSSSGVGGGGPPRPYSLVSPEPWA